ncbi:MAG: ARMT1-like domain-containing protein [Candidatus Riflebacteria bacterium]|jgi:uncharacterized protein with ATP-grasp and redox domains|nr:ARMT1-like domain-containing protein [Candidatus Riflebacteria bacterium]
MKMSLDCIPCFIRQALDAARMTSDNPAVHEKILSEVLQWACNVDLKQPAPMIGQRIHQRLRQIVGRDDPYRNAKDHQNNMAMAMLPELQARIDAASDPLDMALRIAIAGNVIDLGVPGTVTDFKIRETLENCLTEPLIGKPEEFKAAVAKARKILYLTDNAGEIAFDRLLIARLRPERVTVAVRGGPAINDATIPDAIAVGMPELVKVTDNGSDAPGTVLSDCSQSFRQLFKEADMIIAKGQGNFETLSDEPGNIFFLFKAKCKVIADHAEVKLGSHVVTSFYTSDN